MKYPANVNLNDANARINPFSADNMDSGEQPDVLKNLSLIEQILISPVKPLITLFRLSRDGQYGFRGQVINFNQNLDQFVNQLLRTLESLSDIIVVRREVENYDSFSEFCVRKNVVSRALNWLMENNSL